jgi:radical SAM-linked protein
MGKIRVRFTKTGKARYISHLDLMATMQRAFIRAGVRLKYSEGFNPHPYMSVALPLPVGVESLCELMDVEIIDSELPCDINRFLPEGIVVLGTYTPLNKFKSIKWISVSCKIHYDDPPDDIFKEMLHKHFTAASLIIQKKTKSGVSDVDIAPFIREVTLGSGDVVDLTAKISAQNPTISQNDIFNIIRGNEETAIPNNIEIKRIEIYNEDMVIFS